MNIKQRIFSGVTVACLFGGISLVHINPIAVSIGWCTIGFAIGASVDFILMVLG